jgi:hypothetical protein
VNISAILATISDELSESMSAACACPASPACGSATFELNPRGRHPRPPPLFNRPNGVSRLFFVQKIVLQRKVSLNFGFGPAISIFNTFYETCVSISTTGKEVLLPLSAAQLAIFFNGSLVKRSLAKQGLAVPKGIPENI